MVVAGTARVLRSTARCFADWLALGPHGNPEALPTWPLPPRCSVVNSSMSGHHPCVVRLAIIPLPRYGISIVPSAVGRYSSNGATVLWKQPTSRDGGGACGHDRACGGACRRRPDWPDVGDQPAVAGVDIAAVERRARHDVEGFQRGGHPRSRYSVSGVAESPADLVCVLSWRFVVALWWRSAAIRTG